LELEWKQWRADWLLSKGDGWETISRWEAKDVVPFANKSARAALDKKRQQWVAQLREAQGKLQGATESLQELTGEVGTLDSVLSCTPLNN
tara:strand:- start:274 stop:543 length:270 start_codon:yes stop_codon:yes gene_type:complete